MAKALSQEDIKKINEIYNQVHTYAEVSRQLGFAPSTVKKYIVKDYALNTQIQIKKFDGNINSIDERLFYTENWGELCVFSNEEYEEIKELWKELRG